MKLNQLQKINNKELEKIKPGFAFTALLTNIPLLASALASLVGLFKSAFSTSGEIKDKVTTYKWNNETKASSAITKTNYIIF
ncbi:hypothetical protein BCF59_0595 [Mycoplasmopsis mustelae]|uniref:Uncharacterized protein n=1 Tax=Mycoplasmopsis mustelae TaxID=171289 RepID=A0A4R7UDD8_9BACT|nr:hypothetical protein [Mycoplasmopsis mustelae]TDV23250.1 hypothetical protein BCF59_0595 [Mycoplasmopsis mustelae]